MGSLMKLRYCAEKAFRWEMPAKVTTQVIPLSALDEICDSCESVKNDEIKKIKVENKKLKRLIEFLEGEISSLELKTALSEKAIPFKKVIQEFTSTPEGKKAWESSWKEQFNEWGQQAKEGKISKVKYFRLINGMDQATLAKKLKTAQPNISRIEKPGYNIPVKTLEKLAKILKVKRGDLIGD